MAWTPVQRWAAGLAGCLLVVGVATDLLDHSDSKVTLSASSSAADTSDPLATASPDITATSPGPATPAPTTTVSIAPTTDPAPSPTATHAVVVKKVVVTQRVPFAKRMVKDSSMLKGTTKVVAKGRIGYRQRIYQYTYRDGVVVRRTLIGIKVTRKPIARVTHVGTKAKPASGGGGGGGGGNCDPNYSGCVPIASDVDCAGGSGNGPAYVSGPVRVIGTDIYGLDADGDGIGCE